MYRIHILAMLLTAMLASKAAAKPGQDNMCAALWETYQVKLIVEGVAFNQKAYYCKQSETTPLCQQKTAFWLEAARQSQVAYDAWWSAGCFLCC